jgi:hypothetical protein
MSDENEQEPSIEESMAEVYDEIQKREEADEPQPETDSPGEDDPAPVEASTDEAEPVEEPEAEDEPEGDDTPDAAALEQVEAPAYWSEESRAQFDALPDEAKNVVLEQAKNANADYTRKATELAEQRKAGQPLQAVTDKWNGYLQQQGTTAELAFDNLMQTQHALRTGTPEQKRQALESIRQTYGISDAEEDEYRDPELASLESQIQSLSSQVNQNQTTQYQSQLDAANQSISQFANEVDGNGDLKHPHFDTVQAKMTELIAGNDDMDLQAAYEAASEPINSLVSERVAKAQAAAQAKVKTEKAKKAAAVNVSSSSPPGGSKKPVGKWNDTSAMAEIYDSVQ